MSEISVSERLNGYYNFDPTVVETVAEFADRQATYPDFQTFFDEVGATAPFNYEYNGGDFQIVDIRPREHDETHAMLVRLGMANPLDNNQIYQLATLAGTNPNTRIIAMGNASGGGYEGGSLSTTDNHTIANGDFAPLAKPLRAYAHDTGADVLDEVGFSFGAHVAMSDTENEAIDNLVIIEAVTKAQGLARLGWNFLRTSSMLDTYVAASGLQTFLDARKQSIPLSSYTFGLFKPTNIATTRGLVIQSQHTKEIIADQVYCSHVGRMTGAWGSKSELGDDVGTTDLFAELVTDPDNHVQAIRLEGQKHLFANDVHLFASIVKQSQLS